MMQLCRLFVIPILCWTSLCFGAAVLEPPNAANSNNDQQRILDTVAEAVAVGANGGQDTTTTITPAAATGPLEVKVSVLTGAGEKEEKKKVEEKSSNFLENGKSRNDNVVDNVFKEREENTNSLNSEALLSRRIKRSYAPGVNFINILCTTFSYKSVLSSFSLVAMWLCNFMAQEY